MTFYSVEKDYDIDGHVFIERIVKPILDALVPGSRAYLGTKNPTPTDWQRDVDRQEIERHVYTMMFEDEDFKNKLRQLPREVADLPTLRKERDVDTSRFEKTFDDKRDAVWWHRLEAGNPNSVDRVEEELIQYLDKIHAENKPNGKNIDGWIVVRSGEDASYPTNAVVMSPKLNNSMLNVLEILENRGTQKRSKGVFDIYNATNRPSALTVYAYYDYASADEFARKADIVGVRALGPKRVIDLAIVTTLDRITSAFHTSDADIADRKYFHKISSRPEKMENGVRIEPHRLPDVKHIDIFVDKLVDAFWAGRTMLSAYNSLDVDAKSIINALYIADPQSKPSMIVFSPAGFQGSRTSRKNYEK